MLPALVGGSKEPELLPLPVACGTCNLREHCLPLGLAPDEIDYLDKAIHHRRHFKRGDHLYRTGTVFRSLFAIRSGFFKTYVVQEDGREQVTGFQMMGEIMGMDAISAECHPCNALALEDSDICEIPFQKLEQLGHQMPVLQHHFHKMMSREIVRDQSVMLLLGTMKAEERLATFLLNLSQRFAARGYSRTEFVLRMTREDIGNFLGVKLETVSRTLSQLQQDGVLSVQNKSIKIISLEALKRAMGFH
jgi:CRP/FNR family transcriptional regulator, anaerobic regulatory protein